MVRIKPERFPTGTYKKLHPISAGPFEILKKISSNAYVLDLPTDMNISSTFYVEDLRIYHGHYQDESFKEQDIQLPLVPAPREEIEDVYDDQIVSTKTGGYHKFLVKLKGKSFSKATWITAIDFQRLNPDLYERYQADNSPESNFSKPGGGGWG